MKLQIPLKNFNIYNYNGGKIELYNFANFPPLLQKNVIVTVKLIKKNYKTLFKNKNSIKLVNCLIS